MTTKRCTYCKEEKDANTTNFRAVTRFKCGYYFWCKSCESIKRRAYYQKNLERQRRVNRDYSRRNKGRIHGYFIKRKFGINSETYDFILDVQNGVCAVCKGTNSNGRKLSVDHDHKTGEVRGLLCSLCNSALGHARDDATLLHKLIDYLKYPPAYWAMQFV